MLAATAKTYRRPPPLGSPILDAPALPRRACCSTCSPIRSSTHCMSRSYEFTSITAAGRADLRPSPGRSDRHLQPAPLPDNSACRVATARRHVHRRSRRAGRRWGGRTAAPLTRVRPESRLQAAAEYAFRDGAWGAWRLARRAVRVWAVLQPRPAGVVAAPRLSRPQSRPLRDEAALRTPTRSCGSLHATRAERTKQVQEACSALNGVPERYRRCSTCFCEPRCPRSRPFARERPRGISRGLLPDFVRIEARRP